MTNQLMKLVASDGIDGATYVPLTEQEIAELEAIKAAGEAFNNHQAIIEAINALEAEITPRRLREAVLDESAMTWLQEQEDKIAELRIQL